MHKCHQLNIVTHTKLFQLSLIFVFVHCYYTGMMFVYHRIYIDICTFKGWQHEYDKHPNKSISW